MTGPGTCAGGPLAADADDDERCWQEASRLRREQAGWVIIWLAPAGEYRACRRLPGKRRDTALAARTPAGLAAQIGQAGQAARRPAARPRSRHEEDQP
jgi:hypothetical protein